ncbi:AfsR/SARP family transcriptional regulator [Saccharopolyspora phatthalungensis]|uniref:DNA-binding SARP family transcriptional activator n=1 Tax=Saccharopolyspora phatthalungensis TaxID=664693 RepID=A0A840Q661_9PSEU|nr:AfsR/SARP family transcriptional regulator [Saccharopolyspora phatthalungensis]MBB5158002.1 DNA-binding SARP family transcriptional activator [Saccharopolyspora phatthalungensis]
MQFSVLGPLVLTSEFASPVLKAAKPKQILALLTIRANTIVSMHELIAEVWDEAPPVSAVTTIQSYVVQLRKLLATAANLTVPADAKRILSTEHNGYVLRIPNESLDLQRFMASARLGAQALADGDDEGAARQLREALDLWRGPALVDVPHGPLLSTHVTAMEQCRMSVLEQRVEADLRLGRHHALLTELTALTADRPFNENLAAKFMLALYRSGQRWKALSVYQELRHSLVEQLGLEPSLTLIRLQHAILNSDPTLDSPPGNGKPWSTDELMLALAQPTTG